MKTFHQSHPKPDLRKVRRFQFHWMQWVWFSCDARFNLDTCRPNVNDGASLKVTLTTRSMLPLKHKAWQSILTIPS